MRFVHWLLFPCLLVMLGVAVGPSLHTLTAYVLSGNGCSVRSASLSRKILGHCATLSTQKTPLARDGRLEQWATPIGNLWCPRGTDWRFIVAEQIVRVYGDGEDRVRSGDIVLDCGANIGTFTREALSAGASKVVAIEPVPANVECLRRNFRAEIEAGRVLVVPKGVWDSESHLEMNLYDSTALDSFVMTERAEEGRATGRVSLPLTTIDSIVSALNLSRVDFIKMDIEGAERRALNGARDTIRSFRPRMSIATENLPDDYLAVPRTVASIEPAYGVECGECSVRGITLHPEVLYFAPKMRSSSGDYLRSAVHHPR